MGKSNKGINSLARILDNRIGRHTEQDLALDFGTVKKNGTLQTNTFPKAIGKGDYSVLQHCDSDIKEGVEKRVLVAWVESEAVIVGVLVE